MPLTLVQQVFATMLTALCLRVMNSWPPIARALVPCFQDEDEDSKRQEEVSKTLQTEDRVKVFLVQKCDRNCFTPQNGSDS